MLGCFMQATLCIVATTLALVVDIRTSAYVDKTLHHLQASRVLYTSDRRATHPRG